MKEEGGGGGREGAKGVALQMSPATYRYPGIMGLFPGPPEKGGLELGPTRNQTRPEPEFEFPLETSLNISAGKRLVSKYCQQMALCISKHLAWVSEAGWGFKVNETSMI